MANKLLSPDQQQKIAKALQERKEGAIATVGKAAKSLAIGAQDSQGPVSQAHLYSSVPNFADYFSLELLWVESRTQRTNHERPNIASPCGAVFQEEIHT